jgi:DNA-binding NarL/FixJ family response regulator
LLKLQKTQEEQALVKNAQLEKQAARESALAKLAALGLTEEEIAAL